MKIEWVIRIATAVAIVAGIAGMAQAGQGGNATHDEVLLGMHFIEGNGDAQAIQATAKKSTPKDVANALSIAALDDYLKYMPDDLKQMSYADFWKWWFEFERYKGDEAGLAAFDKTVNKLMERGMKVKVDLAYNTHWAMDNDWTTVTNRVIGPRDKNDWIHLCELLGRRYNGKIVLYLLQGESNNLADYWEKAPVEHVSEIFRTGYQAFKKEDPNLRIAIAGGLALASGGSSRSQGARRCVAQQLGARACGRLQTLSRRYSNELLRRNRRSLP